MIDFQSKLAELINETVKDKTVNKYFIPASDIINLPDVYFAVACTPYNIDLLTQVASQPLHARGMVAITSRGGREAAHVRVVDICATAAKLEKILSIHFEAWNIQERPETIMIVAVGKRHVEAVRELLEPVLEKSEAAHKAAIIDAGTKTDTATKGE